jgi:hypothetical protein
VIAHVAANDVAFFFDEACKFLELPWRGRPPFGVEGGIANLKAGITKPSRYEPGVNRTYQDLADGQ